MRLSNSKDYFLGGSTKGLGQITLTQYMDHEACPGKICVKCFTPIFLVTDSMNC